MLSGVHAVQQLIMDLLKYASSLLWHLTMQSCCQVFTGGYISAFIKLATGLRFHTFCLDVISSCMTGVLTAVLQVQGLSSSCCGMMFNSRGFKGAASHMGQQLEQSLVKASDGGKIPIVMDTSPCLAQMKGALTDPALRSACGLQHKRHCCFAMRQSFCNWLMPIFVV